VDWSEHGQSMENQPKRMNIHKELMRSRKLCECNDEGERSRLSNAG
jgi:hypothetical protein